MPHVVGQTSDAVAILWSSFYDTREADARLVELYSSAGQLKALQEILDEMDRRSRQQLKASMGARFDPATMDETRRAQNMRKMIAMRHAAATGDWAKVIQELRYGVSKPRGYSPQDWTRFWEPVYAARLLATKPQETVPLVVRDLDSMTGEDATAPNWHDLALGMAGTSPAVKKLRERAAAMPQEELPAPGFWIHPAGGGFVSIVTYAGAPGDKLLQELAAAPQTKPSLRRALVEWKKRSLPTEIKEVTFPPARKDAKLPLTAEAAFPQAKTPSRSEWGEVKSP